VNNCSDLQSILTYALSIKKTDASGLVIEDNQYDNLKGDLVDFAFGTGVTAYLNLSGMGKPEKAAKVARYAAILEQIR
jgi:hypothetical protein